MLLLLDVELELLEAGLLELLEDEDGVLLTLLELELEELELELEPVVTAASMAARMSAARFTKVS